MQVPGGCDVSMGKRKKLDSCSTADNMFSCEVQVVYVAMFLLGNGVGGVEFLNGPLLWICRLLTGSLNSFRS